MQSPFHASLKDNSFEVRGNKSICLGKAKPLFLKKLLLLVCFMEIYIDFKLIVQLSAQQVCRDYHQSSCFQRGSELNPLCLKLLSTKQWSDSNGR